MINRKKVLTALLLCMSALLFAKISTSELTEKYLELISVQMENQNYREAFNTVNAALKFNDQNGIPAELAVASVDVYLNFMDLIRDKGDFSVLSEIESNINHYDFFNDERIKSKYEELKIINQGLHNAARKAVLARTISSVWIVSLILCLFFILAIVVIKIAFKQNDFQVKQLQETLMVVANLRQNNRSLLGSVKDLHQLEGLRFAGKSSWGQNALPEPELNDQEKEELQDLAIFCEDLGAKVDQATKRKNNSKNVSEMVYKLAVALGCNQNTANAYFCAAMVYDAGFLAIPQEMLGADSLTDQQKEIIHDHVNKTEEYFEQVPEKYKKIFQDAAKFHHENEDGSGYPEGIKGNNIPQIAKLIHVVESYISLSSRRHYKTIMDKESAVEELLKTPELYDAEIVKALDSIV